MSNIDKAATRARNFKDPKSKVMRDGREILGKKDWRERVAELIKRARGSHAYARCEYRYPGGRGQLYRCIQTGCIPSHIVPRKDITQRDDRLENLAWQCFAHDRLTEGQNWRRTRFGERAAHREQQATQKETA